MSVICLAKMAKAHSDIRWNPELHEWFCASCGQTSDDVAEEDAVREMAAFDCSLHGTTIAKLEKERLLRAHYLSKRQKQNE